MKYFLVIIVCIAIILLIECIYNRHLDKLPKQQRDYLIKKQSKQCCPVCGGTDFEVSEMKGKIYRKLKWKCKHCGHVK